jgi:hypothetical protein
MYMGFYRVGEWKYFVVDAIRYLVTPEMLSLIHRANTLLYSFGQPVHYQTSRVVDDFFIPCKHNFHPSEVIHDIELLGGKVYHFDGDLREYNHEGVDYFSIGGDRIYITKDKETNVKVEDVLPKMKTKKGRNQILDMNYTEGIVLENIELVKEIKKRREAGQLTDMDIVLLTLNLYQMTRPFIPKQSEVYQRTVQEGRHKTFNFYLRNCLEFLNS